MASSHPPRQHLSRFVPRSQIALLVAIIGVSVVDSVLLGYDSSLMGSLNVMATYSDYFTLNTSTKSLNTASSFVGGACACFVSGWFADYFGRRKGMFLSCAITLIGAVIQAAAQNIGMFIAARFIIGFGLGFAQTSCVPYVAETIPPKYRAFGLGMFFSCWNVGTLIASGVCYGTSPWSSNWAWRLPSLIQIVPSILAAMVVMILPESPRWLINQDRHDEALEVLAAVNAGGDKDAPSVILQYREITDTIAWEKAQHLSFFKSFSGKANRKRLVLVATFSIISMLPGTNIITFYFGDMLTQAGINNSTTQLQINIILTAWTMVFSIVGSWFADAVGRRTLCALSLAGQIVTFYALAGLTAVYGGSTDKSGIYGTIAMIFLYNAAYGYGIIPLTVLYPPEILPFSIRATGMGLYTFCAKVCGLFVTMAMPYALNAIGWKTYIINASVDFLMLAGVILFWVETRGLTLEEVDKKFDGVKHSDVPDLKEVIEGEVEMGSESIKQQVKD
ncbi:Hexose transporter [Pleurostoma richardsiae]|uniref:Hexose transporter n=1 Tax=Pleurostoma richardsiae TaxID=41990 RepID=A0AA38S4Q2_9PEZI|nr:Hexose transporter [Pleurostoma richardsiae]